MRAIKVYCPPGVEPPLYAFIDALDGKLKATLAVALLSTECFESECCHITLLPLEDAHDFFAAHSSDYASQDFYSGQWC